MHIVRNRDFRRNERQKYPLITRTNRLESLLETQQVEIERLYEEQDAAHKATLSLNDPQTSIDEHTVRAFEARVQQLVQELEAFQTHYCVTGLAKAVSEHPEIHFLTTVVYF